MTDKPIPRPRQVSLLGYTILVGSAFVVLLAFDQIASLGSIEAQEAAEKLVSEPPGKGLGLTVDEVQTALRILGVIAGGCATAAAFLGWQVLQRARSARLALSLLAPVLLVAGVATAGFLTAVVVAAIAMLWVQPARDWFAGKQAAPHPALDRTPATAPATAPAAAPALAKPATDPTSYGAPPPSSAAMHTPARRPGTVLAAGITTIVSSSIVIAGVAVALLLVLGDRAAFERDVTDELSSQAAYEDLDPSVLVDVVVAMLVVFAIWAAIAILLAVLAVRGSNVARIALVVSSIMAALASLVGILVIAPLFITGACIAVTVLLLRGEASAWYAARSR